MWIASPCAPGAPVKPVTPSTFASVAASAQPGDILELAAGSYSGFTFSRDGAPGQPIVLRSDGGAVVSGVVYLDDRQWVYLDGLTVNGRVRMNSSSHMAVMRCTVTIPVGASAGQSRSGIVFLDGHLEHYEYPEIYHPTNAFILNKEIFFYSANEVSNASL